MANILDTSRALGSIPGLTEELLQAGHRFLPVPEGALTETTMMSLIEEADAAIAGAKEPYSAPVLQAGKRLRVVARVGVGFDNVDTEAATALGVTLTLTPGAIEESVADHTLALLLACARRICDMNASVHRGQWTRLLGMELEAKTLGILGLGRIGKAVARRAQAFGIRVATYDPYLDPAYATDHEITLMDDWRALLAVSDIVSLHLPMTRDSKGLVNQEFLAAMKPGSIFINAARGPMVDEQALADAVKSGHLRAAGLDVLVNEPPDAACPLLNVPNVVLAPHVASYTDEAWARMVSMAARSVVAIFNGEIPLGTYNRDALNHPRWQGR